MVLAWHDDLDRTVDELLTIIDKHRQDP